MALAVPVMFLFLGNCPFVILNSLKMVPWLTFGELGPHLSPTQSIPLARKDVILLGLAETKLWAWPILFIRNKTLFS